MESTKKMKLVPYEAPVRPAITSVISNKLLSLDSEMEKVLQDKSLSAEQKVQKYTAVMQNYMDYKKQLPTVHDIAPAETMTPMETPDASINSLPGKSRKQTRKKRKNYGPFDFSLKWLPW